MLNVNTNKKGITLFKGKVGKTYTMLNLKQINTKNSSIFKGKINTIFKNYLFNELGNNYEFEYGTGYLNNLSYVVWCLNNQTNEVSILNFIYTNLYNYSTGNELHYNLGVILKPIFLQMGMYSTYNISLFISYLEQHFNVPNQQRIFSNPI